MSETTYSQRYATADTNTTGSFVFDTVSGHGDVAVSKAAFGAVGSLTYVDASNPLPVTISGVATAANQATGNASLATIAGAVSGTEMQVDVVTMPTVAITAASLPLPSGAATAAKQPALGTAGTASADVLTVQGIASMTALKVDGSAVTQPVSIASAVPITDNSGSLTVDDGGLTLSIDDGAGSITVDGTVAATQSGNWSVRVQDGSGTAITSATRGSEQALSVQLVDASGNQITSFGGGTQYAEDAASAGGESLTLAGSVRRDTAASSAGTNGDYATINTDSTGRLWTHCGLVDSVTSLTTLGTITNVVHVDDNSGSLTVDADVAAPVFVRLSDGAAAITTLPVSLASVPTHAVTQSGTWNITNVSGTISLPTGAATAAKQPALGTAGTASADVITVQGIASMTALKVDGSAVTQPVSIAAAVAVTDNSGSLTVDNGGTFAVQATIAAGATTIGKAEDVAAADADVGVPAMAVRKATPANTSGTDGDYEMLQMSAGRLWTSAVIDTALPAGTNAIGKLASNSGVTIGAVEIASAQTLATVTTVTTCSTVTTLTGGGVAHDSADSGNPVKVGGKATSSMASRTMVADADRSDLVTGTDGALIVRNNYSLEDAVQERTTNTDGASTAFSSGLGAPGAGVRLWVTSVTVANSSAAFCTVDLRDGSAGSVLWTLPVPATGGVTMRFDPPLKLSANTALAFDASAAITTLSISANGFKSKV